MASELLNNSMDLFESVDSMESEDSVDMLFKRAFKEMDRCKRSVDRLAACEALTPAHSERTHRSLVDQGEEGVVVRVIQGRVDQTCPVVFFTMAKRTKSS